tara:strand:- start:79 stop:483 length:405 start_codon:yes stop_codon:yes gene_type:complete
MSNSTTLYGKKKFRFYYLFQERSDIPWCDIEITVKMTAKGKEVNGKEYYYISYKNTFSDIDNPELFQVNSAHPFHNNDELCEHLDGEIIIKNEMTDAMINYLLMDFDELSKYSGSSEPMHYKGMIMRMFTHLWD